MPDNTRSTASRLGRRPSAAFPPPSSPTTLPGMLARMRTERCYYTEVSEQQKQLFLTPPALPVFTRSNSALKPSTLDRDIAKPTESHWGNYPNPMPFKARPIDEVLGTVSFCRELMLGNRTPKMATHAVGQASDDCWSESGEEGEEDQMEEDAQMAGNVMHGVLSRRIYGPRHPQLLEHRIMASLLQVQGCPSATEVIISNVTPCDTSARDRKYQRDIDVIRQRFSPNCKSCMALHSRSQEKHLVNNLELLNCRARASKECTTTSIRKKRAQHQQHGIVGASLVSNKNKTARLSFPGSKHQDCASRTRSGDRRRHLT